MGLQALSMTQGPEKSTNPSKSKGSDSYAYESSQDMVIQRTLLSTDSLATDHDKLIRYEILIHYRILRTNILIRYRIKYYSFHNT